MEYLIVEHLTTKILKRVFRKVVLDKETGCWIWIGALDPDYGLVWYKGRHEKAHRFMYAWLISPLPRGREARIEAQLDHVVCKNTRCCNPLHVELVTQYVNTMRGTGPSAENARKQTCPRGHVYDAFWGRETKGRYCKRCDRERRRNEDPVTRQRRREICARNHQLRMSGPSREEYIKKRREATARHREARKVASVNG